MGATNVIRFILMIIYGVAGVVLLGVSFRTLWTSGGMIHRRLQGAGLLVGALGYIVWMALPLAVDFLFQYSVGGWAWVLEDWYPFLFWIQLLLPLVAAGLYAIGGAAYYGLGRLPQRGMVLAIAGVVTLLLQLPLLGGFLPPAVAENMATGAFVFPALAFVRCGWIYSVHNPRLVNPDFRGKGIFYWVELLLLSGFYLQAALWPAAPAALPWTLGLLLTLNTLLIYQITCRATRRPIPLASY